MTSRAMIEAWALLVVLSAGTTALTLADATGPMRIGIAAAVLILAGIKARTILNRYLGLSGSQFWTRGFDLAITIFLLVGFALYAMAGGV